LKFSNKHAYFFRRPVLDFETRIATVRMSGIGDEVVEAPLIATPEFVEANNIDFVTHGSDWTEDMVILVI
jgi:glycerol-3-phosphate cytidylyltransferase-like family protein